MWVSGETVRKWPKNEDSGLKVKTLHCCFLSTQKKSNQLRHLKMIAPKSVFITFSPL
jgi:hypothetical protein